MIRKYWWIIMLLVVAVALGTAGYVYANGRNPQNPIHGMMGGQGMMNGRGNIGPGQFTGQTGILHDEMLAAFAEKLDVSVEDLNTRLENGETMWQIAESQGIASADLPALMADVRAAAIDAAVLNGDLTQEQADWLKQRGMRMGGNGQRGMRAGGCPGLTTTPQP